MLVPKRKKIAVFGVLLLLISVYCSHSVKAQLNHETAILVDMKFEVAYSGSMEQQVTAVPGQAIQIFHRINNPFDDAESADVTVAHSIVQGQNIISRFDSCSCYYPDDNSAHINGNNYFSFDYSLIPNNTGTIEIKFYNNGTLRTIDDASYPLYDSVCFSDVTINVENPTILTSNNMPLFAWIGIVLLSVSTVSLTAGIFVMQKKWTNKKNLTQNDVSAKAS
jgi:hypothetical protein